MIRKEGVAIVIFMAACSQDGSTEPQPSGARSPETAPLSEPPAAAEPDPTTPPPTARPTKRDVLDFRHVRIEPQRFVGSTQLCDIRFAEGPLPVETEPEPAAFRGASPPRAAPSRRMNIECASSSGHGTWIDLRIPDSASPAELSVGSRIEVQVLEAYGGTANHSIARFTGYVGPGEAPARDRTTPPHDGFDFTQVRRNRSLLRTTQVCRVDFASEISPIDRNSRARPAYPDDASLRMDLRCIHEGGDSWLDLIFTEEDAEDSLRVERGARLPLSVRTSRGGYADYPVARIATEPAPTETAPSSTAAASE